MTTTMKTTTAAAPASTQSYAQAHAALAAIADRLRTASASISLDTLLADVQAARRLHAHLKHRLEAVRREIETEVAASDADPHAA